MRRSTCRRAWGSRGRTTGSRLKGLCGASRSSRLGAPAWGLAHGARDRLLHPELPQGLLDDAREVVVLLGDAVERHALFEFLDRVDVRLVFLDRGIADRVAER